MNKQFLRLSLLAMLSHLALACEPVIIIDNPPHDPDPIPHDPITGIDYAYQYCDGLYYDSDYYDCIVCKRNQNAQCQFP